MGDHLRPKLPEKTLVQANSAGSRIGPIVTVVRWAPMRPEELLAYGKMMSEAPFAPGGIGLLVVIEPHRGTPHPMAKTAMKQALDGVNGRLRALGMVLLGDGLCNALYGGLAATMNLWPERTYPVQTFEDVGTGVRWLRERLPHSPPEEALLTHVLEMRSLADLEHPLR